jgi:hypothetical protein
LLVTGIKTAMLQPLNAFRSRTPHSVTISEMLRNVIARRRRVSEIELPRPTVMAHRRRR